MGTEPQKPRGQPGPPPKPKRKVKLSGKSEKESEGAVGGPIPGFKGTKKSLGPAGAPVNKLTGKVFKKQGGGMANTGRTNLLEEVGRIDAEHMNPNRRAEKSRVIGELNRGYKKGGGVVKARVGKMMRKEKEPKEKQHTLLSTGKKIPKSEVDKMKWGVRQNKKQAQTKTDYDYRIGALADRSSKYHIDKKEKFAKEHPIASKIASVLPGSKSNKEIKKLMKDRYEDITSKRGLLKSAKGGIAKKQGGGAMYSRGYGVGEKSKRTPTALLDRGPAYKKGGVIKAETGIMAGGPKSAGPSSKYADIFKKARKRYSGRLKRDDLDPTKSTARERAIADQHKKKKPRKTLLEILKPKASVAGPHRDIVGKRKLKTLLGKLPNAKPAKVGVAGKIREALGYKGGGIAKRGLGIIKKG